MSESSYLLSCGGSKVGLWQCDFERKAINNKNPKQRSSSSPCFAAFAPSKLSSLISVAYSDGSIELRHTHKNSRLTLKPRSSMHEKTTSVVQEFSPDASMIATATDSGELSVWELKTQTCVNSVSLSCPINSVSFNSSNFLLAASSSIDGRIFIFSVKEMRLVATLSSHSSQIENNCAKFSPHQDNTLVSLDDHGTITIWDVSGLLDDNKVGMKPTCSIVGSLKNAHAGAGTGIAFSPTSSLLCCTCGLDKNIVFFDLYSKKVIKKIRLNHPVTCVDFNSNGRIIAAGAANGQILIYDLKSKSQAPIIKFTAQKEQEKLVSVRFQALKSTSRTPQEMTPASKIFQQANSKDSRTLKNLTNIMNSNSTNSYKTPLHMQESKSYQIKDLKDPQDVDIFSPVVSTLSKKNLAAVPSSINGKSTKEKMKSEESSYNSKATEVSEDSLLFETPHGKEHLGPGKTNQKSVNECFLEESMLIPLAKPRKSEKRGDIYDNDTYAELEKKEYKADNQKKWILEESMLIPPASRLDRDEQEDKFDNDPFEQSQNEEKRRNHQGLLKKLEERVEPLSTLSKTLQGNYLSKQGIEHGTNTDSEASSQNINVFMKPSIAKNLSSEPNLESTKKDDLYQMVNFESFAGGERQVLEKRKPGANSLNEEPVKSTSSDFDQSEYSGKNLKKQDQTSIQDMMADIKEEIRSELRNMYIDMLRQGQEQNEQIMQCIDLQKQLQLQVEFLRNDVTKIKDYLQR